MSQKPKPLFEYKFTRREKKIKPRSRPGSQQQRRVVMKCRGHREKDWGIFPRGGNFWRKKKRIQRNMLSRSAPSKG